MQVVVRKGVTSYTLTYFGALGTLDVSPITGLRHTMDDRSIDPFTLTIGGTKDSRSHLRVVDHRFVIGKEEFLPHVAEMHYFRVAKRHWSVCFERIRKANFRIISTAVPWNLHETRQGEFDFAGASDPAKDLIVFLELCREFGFKIVLRPGPWLGQEWDNGGIPDFAVRNPVILAKNSQGEALMADPGAGAKPVAMPSYLSSRYQIILKNYFSVFTEVVRNYIYPRGPVFMIELDHETSFGGQFDPLAGDFNAEGSLESYPRFLEEKFATVDHLNRRWRTKYKEFSDALPPETKERKAVGDFLRLMDWIEFREWVVNRYAETVAELLSRTEISVLFARSMAFNGAYHFPQAESGHLAGRVLYTVNLDWDTQFADTVRRARSVSGWQATGFCTNLAVGGRHPDPEVGHKYRPVTPKDTGRLLVAGLAAGLKGFNFHMFVGRDRWYDGALESDGAINPSYDTVKGALARLTEVRYDLMRDFADVALVQYRPYQRVASMGSGGSHGYIADLCGPGFDAVASDLMALSYDYRIFDLDFSDRLDKYGTVVVPVGEFMAPEAQRRLVEMLKGGAHLILFGVLPKFDLNLEPCDILAKAIGFRTTNESHVVTVETKRHHFRTRTYGALSRTPTRASKLGKVGTKLVAATCRSGKGQVTVMTFSPGSLLRPEKLVFFHEVLQAGKLSTPVFSSDPRVHVTLHGHEKAALLMIYDMAEILGVADDVSDSPTGRGVIIGADIAVVGLSLQRFTMSDIFSDDSRKIVAKELKSGIEIRLGRGDSRLYTIERRERPVAPAE